MFQNKCISAHDLDSGRSNCATKEDTFTDFRCVLLCQLMILFQNLIFDFLITCDDFSIKYDIKSTIQ